MDRPAIDPSRSELLQLRARVVALERAVIAALELVLRIRPEELSMNLEKARRLLELGYKDVEFAPDISDAKERRFLASEVERLMRALQAEMGFSQGIHSDENG